MFSKLLLVLGIAFGYGSNLTLKTPQKVYDIVYSYDSANNEDFYYYGSLFCDWSIQWLDDGRCMVITAVIQTSYLLEMPNKVFDYFYLGNFGDEYDFNNVVVFYPGCSFLINSPLNNSFPFVKSNNYVFYDKSLFPETSFDYVITVNFGYKIESNARVYAEYGFIYEVAFTNELGIANYYADLQNIAYNDGYTDGYNEGANDFYDVGYDDGFIDGTDEGYIGGYTDGLQDGYEIGFSDAEYVGDGTWLGNLVFGTIGGIVGFLFALSDFEVLGVSIMSIITLFVAIGIVRLLLKVLK